MKLTKREEELKDIILFEVLKGRYSRIEINNIFQYISENVTL